jgi:hypothetical protein
LGELAEQPLGRVLLALISVGFAGYAFWRFLQAWTYHEEGDEPRGKATVKRVGYVARGVVYAGLAFLTVKATIAEDPKQQIGAEQGSASSDGGGLLASSAGRWILAGVGIGYAAVAGYQVYQVVTRKFEKNWKKHEMSKNEERTARALGMVGVLTRAVMFGLVAFFLARAAITFNPAEPKGLDQTLAAVASQGSGSLLLYGLAIGFLAFAGFCFAESRWRRVLD